MDLEEKRENIIEIDINKEMKTSYLDYAMSVIVSRALPDVRDGLKPVHRRIIYAMNELNMAPNKQYRKSARLVGDVLGKYHPHGDSSVYDAMVRLAQDFNTRYLLVDGHGNFGSIDGDSAAAMRYTEARMTNLTLELLRDIEKDTVAYRLNFDETLKEPVVLPSRFPNLLVNGSSGIAVGMATNIPPHNLREVIDGIVMMIDNKETDVEDLMDIIKGPDFPTGGHILGKEGIRSAYRTGRGKILLRAVADIEYNEKTRDKIIITEIPYQVNKARLIERMADLVKEKRIEGIAVIRDESDREGLRLVIEVSRDANPEIVLNNLYKHTQLQVTFGAIMLALVDGEPRVLNLKQILDYYLDHQVEIITRRTEFDLNKALTRAHIVEGLRIAQENIDDILKIIRESDTDDLASNLLEEKYELSKEQSKAILDMRLRRLTGLERDKLDHEYKELNETIDRLRTILADEDKILAIIKEELLEIKDKYGDDRRSEIVPYAGEIILEDMIDEEDVVITLTHFGYIKRMPEDLYRTQKRGGRGVAALTTRDEDFVEDLYITSTHDRILFFTNLGKVYSLRAFEIPESGRQARGTAIVNLLKLDEGEKVSAIIPIEKETDYESLCFVTKEGITKRVDLSHFENIRISGIIAITLKEEDELISVRKTKGNQEIFIVTKKGKAIRFKESDVREMGRTAMGVMAIKLSPDDEVVSMEVGEENDERYLLTISEYGFGKRTALSEYKTQKRGGLGVLTYNIKEKTGDLVGARIVSGDDEALIITLNGTIIRLSVDGISSMGRNTQGVTLIKTEDGDKVVALAKYQEEDDFQEEE